jgi:hypothetical protein
MHEEVNRSSARRSLFQDPVKARGIVGRPLQVSVLPELLLAQEPAPADLLKVGGRFLGPAPLHLQREPCTCQSVLPLACSSAARKSLTVHTVRENV